MTFISVPENGAPCPTFWESKGNESSARDEELKSIMEGNFLLCHNGHNREWINEKVAKWQEGHLPRVASKLNMTKWTNFEYVIQEMINCTCLK